MKSGVIVGLTFLKDRIRLTLETSTHDEFFVNVYKTYSSCEKVTIGHTVWIDEDKVYYIIDNAVISYSLWIVKEDKSGVIPLQEIQMKVLG